MVKQSFSRGFMRRQDDFKLERRLPPGQSVTKDFPVLSAGPTPHTHQVFRGQDEIQLSAKEFDLLELFLRHPHQVLTRVQIYEHVWRYDFGGDGNHIEVYVCYLRTKLEATGKPRLIQTVRGVGYVLRTA